MTLFSKSDRIFEIIFYKKNVAEIIYNEEIDQNDLLPFVCFKIMLAKGIFF